MSHNQEIKISDKVIEPAKPVLPETCYSILPSSGEVILIRNGESGYYPTDLAWMNDAEKREFVDHRNQLLSISKAQEAAMLAGSMFGWNVPAADPSRYDNDGKPISSQKGKAPLDNQISEAKSKVAQVKKDHFEKEQGR